MTASTLSPRAIRGLFYARIQMPPEGVKASSPFLLCPGCDRQLLPEQACFCAASEEDPRLRFDHAVFGMSYVTADGCRVPPWKVTPV